MKAFQYTSDLHLEFPQNMKYLRLNPLKPVGDILLLAGDTLNLCNIDSNMYNDFFNYISDNFEKTYMIAGNHEYYNYDLADKCGTFNEKIRENVYLVNNVNIKEDNINLIFSTLWSNIGDRYKLEIQNGMNDFRVIRYDNHILTPNIYNSLYIDNLQFINGELYNMGDNDKSIVVTHHAPTFMHFNPVFKNSSLNQAFGSELFDMIKDIGPDYWIYGHHHYNCQDFSIGETKLVTNQLGYVHIGEHKLFKNNKIIKL